MDRLCRILLALAACLALTALAAAEELWTGIVSDQKCGRNVTLDCTRGCLQSGVAPILIVDNTGEVLLLSPAELFRNHGGDHVEVRASQSDNKLNATYVRILPDQGKQDSAANIDRFRGDYQVEDNHALGIDTFVNDAGEKVLLFSDYQTGAVRELFRTSENKYEFGPGFAIRSPVQATIEFHVVDGQVKELILRSVRREQVARKMRTLEQEVSFRSGDATLRGTLIRPETPEPVPAIVLLHGSGPLTRSSFGPYPRFFVSLGLAVLVYDKRGAGASTGEYLPKNSFYPQPFVDDALAAVSFLKSLPGIKHEQIGLWGSSEGGMLTTQVAAQSKDIAFIINSSGFMMPLWKEMLYNRKAELRAEGYSEKEADEATNYQQQLFSVGRTGNEWDSLHQNTSRLRNRKWFGRFFETETPSVETLRWRWEHVYDFNPLPNVSKVHCPVLGLFGALDTSTPAQLAAANMRRALGAGGNPDVMFHVFPSANHALTIARTGADGENERAPGLAPTVFFTIRDWLQKHAVR